MLRLDHVVLYVASYSVLRSKQRGELDVGVLVKEIGDVTQIVVDGRLITNQTNARAAQEIGPVSKKLFYAKYDGCWFASAHLFGARWQSRRVGRHRFGFFV
jgi:hypothetical protein